MERTYFDICFDVIRSRGEGKFFCLNPAQRAAEKNLTKYNVAHSSKTTSEMDVTDAQSFFRAFPLLSQVFPHVLDPPPAAHMGEPNQVQCCTFIGDDQKVETLQME